MAERVVDDPGYWERIGVALAAGGLVIAGAFKAAVKWLPRPKLKDTDQVAQLGKLVDQLTELSRAEREASIRDDVKYLVSASHENKRDMAALQATVAQLDTRVQNLENKGR